MNIPSLVFSEIPGVALGAVAHPELDVDLVGGADPVEDRLDGPVLPGLGEDTGSPDASRPLLYFADGGVLVGPAGTILELCALNI